MPKDLRALFTQLSVCFDVSFTKPALDAFAEQVGTSPGAFYFFGSPRADQEVGIHLQHTGEAVERRLHITFEFRSGSTAPYQKLSQKSVDDVIKHLLGQGNLKLRHAEFTFAVPKARMVNFPGGETPSDANVVLTGLSYEVVPPADSDVEKGSTMKKDRAGERMTITNWVRWLHGGKAVADFARGFALAQEEALMQPWGS